MYMWIQYWLWSRQDEERVQNLSPAITYSDSPEWTFIVANG